MDGAVYERYKGDGALYTAASGPKLTIRIVSANQNHFARKAAAVEDEMASAAEKEAASKGKKKKRATRTQQASAPGASGSGDRGGGEGGSGGCILAGWVSGTLTWQRSNEPPHHKVQAH